jgi:crotonobetainyl-CoA:carnitine CoA-transferase CaiB-like acyl-CoA transferase
MTHSDTPKGPLHGVRVLDLTRILAGPSSTQLLGDYGADIVKVERPGKGDDTRAWGPPYVRDVDGNETTESAYYMAANRNKRSIALDMSTPEGAETIRQLAAKCDILVENFKTNAGLAGYDLMAQGYGGIMSLTGDPDGVPMKVGVGITDIMCGMYATTAILAALRHRDQTGEGQYIDIGLVDTQVAWLINEGTNYLASGEVPKRRGNQHPNIVPYQVFEVSDGHLIIAVGNDNQFAKFCAALGHPALADDPRYTVNIDRITTREALIETLIPIIQKIDKRTLLSTMNAAGVTCGPIHTLDEVFASDQVAARGMKITMPHPLSGSGTVDLIGNPVKFSQTPVTYRKAPPVCGADTDEILNDWLKED